MIELFIPDGDSMPIFLPLYAHHISKPGLLRHPESNRDVQCSANIETMIFITNG